ncbi:putative membrane protein DUF2214 [Chitinophaga niastensis]|uniref:Putative membrane protein DUF2214 n=1 Tax=Chitinophaga niastensis TaxID=536980 RepID=A0A2P8HDB7_CHINA|nr:DUF2214 family protein [Chitinophaga niastensis]PSL44172.1 putative membrane protein DUF2214 [Chitinophaga niastensis]
MSTLILFQIFLILHLTGLTLMAGTTVADYITFKTFSKRFEQEKEGSLNLLDLMTKLSVLLGIGAALLIVSGIGLMFSTGGVFAHQIWFKIKLMLILMLILNGFLVKGRQESKLKKNIDGNSSNLHEQIKGTILHLKTFYLVQMGIFFVIIILAVFKFN